ncbi:MAG: YhdH/YhfP family quinone oxidoreductase [Bdellovibrionales bacterium]
MKGKKAVFEKSKGLELVETEVNSPHIEVYYSGINYKDALGVTGRGAIFKKEPIVPGIDFSGKALKGEYKGQNVIAQGCGFGESFDGGYTQYSDCTGEHLIPLPKELSPKEAMVLGTAGFTAALAIHRMLQNGLTPESGAVLVSGATGGVGSFAIQILNKLGFRVEALTHRPEHEAYLKDLGAKEVLSPKEVYEHKPRPLEKARWAGVIDNLGGEFLEGVLPQVTPWGVVSSIGLAKGAEFKTTVMPFILRGVSLLGASSTHCPMSLRKELWGKLASDWKPLKIEELIYKEVALEEVLDSSHKILDHKSVKGRFLVNLKK